MSGRPSVLLFWHRRWSSVVPVNGCRPAPRRHSATAAVGCRLLVYGGCDEDEVHREIGRVFSAVHLYDPETRTWSGALTTTGSPAEARAGHCSALIGDNLYIYGGNGWVGGYDSVMILDVSKWQWTGPFAISGCPPESRVKSLSTAAMGAMFIAGGAISGRLRREAFRLDF